MKIFAVILCLFCIAAASVKRVTTRPTIRIDVYLSATNFADADKIAKDIDKELKKAIRKEDKRNVDIKAKQEDKRIEGTYFISDTNAAKEVVTALKGLNKPLQVSGKITIHHCPDEEDPLYYDWGGCGIDERSQYEEIIF